MENVLLTGVTGILGRHILYELLRLYASGEREGHIILIVRPDATGTAEERVRSLLFNRFRPYYLDAYAPEVLLSFITILDTDIDSLTEKHVNVLKEFGFLYVIHAAGSTKLGNDENALQEIYSQNYTNTMFLLRQLKPLPHKFIFIGSSFSCGQKEGSIPDDYVNVTQEGIPPQFSSLYPYRNHYEYFKGVTEHSLINWCGKKGISWQILRPSAICGRLIDEPLYYTPRFNALYDFGRLLYKWMTNESADKVEQVKDFRVLCNPEITFDIVPVDYTAKVIAALFPNENIRQFNIVSSNPMTLGYLLPYMANALGLPCDIVDCPPPAAEMNSLERLYYGKADPYMTPYFTGPFSYFMKSQHSRRVHGIAEVDIHANFDALYAYACHHKFEEPVAVLGFSL